MFENKTGSVKKKKLSFSIHSIPKVIVTSCFGDVAQAKYCCHQMLMISRIFFLDFFKLDCWQEKYIFGGVCTRASAGDYTQDLAQANPEFCYWTLATNP